MKFKKRNVKLFILIVAVILFILTFVTAIHIFGDVQQEIKNEPFEYPKENPMEPKPLTE
jgi:flagellar basal body-associated protein FliL